MDVYFVNDTSSGLNWGSQATTRSLRSLIKNSGGKITGTSYKSSLRTPERTYNRQTVTHSVGVVPDIVINSIQRDPVAAYRSLERVGDVIPRTYDQFDKFAEMVLSSGCFTREVQKIKSSDVVVINGEGLTYSSDDRCTRSLFFIAYLAKNRLNTDCIMTNHTLDITDNKLHDMVENIYPLLDDVVFREPVSARKYSHLCSGYRVSADPGFGYDVTIDADELKSDIRSDKINIRPYSQQRFDPTEPYICVAGNSSYPTKSKYNTDGYFELCKELQKITQNILLVVTAEADEKLLVKIAEELQLPIAGLHTSIPHSIALVANADVYIGGRYHPTVFAAKGGVPIIPFKPNTHKIEGVLELLELDIEEFDPFEIKENIPDILSLVDEYLDDPSQFSYLSGKSEEISTLAEKNTFYLADY